MLGRIDELSSVNVNVGRLSTTRACSLPTCLVVATTAGAKGGPTSVDPSTAAGDTVNSYWMDGLNDCIVWYVVFTPWMMLGDRDTAASSSGDLILYEMTKLRLGASVSAGYDDQLSLTDVNVTFDTFTL